MEQDIRPAGPSEPVIRVHTLGGFRIVVDGDAISDEAWRRRKARQLFKILLSRADLRIGKEYLTGLLWPDSPSETSSTNLRSAIFDLRRVLRDARSAAVVTDRDAVWLSRTHTWQDAEEFERLVHEAPARPDPMQDLLAAHALYAGDFLAEDLYEDWAAERREALKQTWTKVQYQLAHLWEERNAIDEAVAALERVLHADACDERAARELMRLLARHGRRAEGVRVYQKLVNALRDELDVQPSQDTTVVFENELPQLPHRDPRVHNLPPQPGPIVDRAEEVDAVCGQLRRSTVRLVTLLGPGGCGKTRLAIQVAANLMAEFPGGVWFVDLSTIRNPGNVVFAIGRELEIAQPVDDRPHLRRIVETIGRQRLLLVLDNIEQVIEAGDRIVDLLVGCPDLKVLVTSREPLHVRWEHEYQVPPLVEVPALPAAMEVVARSPAVDLFVRRAQLIRPDWQLTASNAGAVAMLCNRLDRLPLAIELAAARVKLFTPEAMLARVGQSLEFLTTTLRDSPERHRHMRVTINWSHDLLNDEERATFRRAAVFASGWTLDAAAHITNDSSDATMDGEGLVLQTLDALADKSLLRVEFQRDGEPRFSMLETIREFASERLAGAGELNVTQARHAAWFLRLAEAAEPELGGPRQLKCLEQLEREHDNLRAALRWSFGGGDPVCGARLAAALSKFWEIHGYLQEAAEWLRQARNVRDRLSADQLARLSRVTGHVAFLRSHYVESRDLLEESLALSRETDDRVGTVETLINLALVTLTSEEDERAEGLLREALALAQELPDASRAASCQQLLGVIDYHHRRLESAAERLERSLALRRERADAWGTAQVLCDLGLVLLAQGRASAAWRQLAEALAIWRQLADAWGLAYALEATALLIGGANPGRAVEWLLTAAQARERVGIQPLPGRRAELQATFQACVTSLGIEAYETARQAARAHDLEVAVQAASAMLSEASPPSIR